MALMPTAHPVPATDEYMHEVEVASNFNESMYFNAIDSSNRLGLFFRLGNRPNEGTAEMTVAIYLPDGRAGFMFARPEIEGNERFEAGGAKIEVVTPFEQLDVSYEGELLLLDNPLILFDPKRAFTESARHRCALKLRYADIAPAWGGELAGDAVFSDFWKGHYEAHVHAVGTLEIGDESWSVNGYGLRDHSWGARTWQSISWYRWLTANFKRDGFVLSLVGSPSGAPRVGGAMLVDGVYEPALDVVINTTWSERDDLQTALDLTIRTTGGTYEIAGRVVSMIPLRHRRHTDDGVEIARIAEGLTEWTWAGRTGHGLSEYLDTLVDGQLPPGAC